MPPLSLIFWQKCRVSQGERTELKAIVTVSVISFLWTILQALSGQLVILKHPTVLHNPACMEASVSRVGTGFIVTVLEHHSPALLVEKVKNFLIMSPRVDMPYFIIVDMDVHASILTNVTKWNILKFCLLNISTISLARIFFLYTFYDMHSTELFNFKFKLNFQNYKISQERINAYAAC